MGDFIAVGKTDEVPDGEMRSYDASGVTVAVANAAGSLYAFDDTCTHRGCSLAEGELDGTTVTCGCHGSEFDIRSGEVLNGPADEAVAHYEIKVEGGEIQVQVP